MKWIWVLYRQRRLTRTFVTGWRRLSQIQQQTQPESFMEVQQMQETAKIWQRSPISMDSLWEEHLWSPSSLKLSMQNHNSELDAYTLEQPASKFLLYCWACEVCKTHCMSCKRFGCQWTVWESRTLCLLMGEYFHKIAVNWTMLSDLS